jgi:hypothetical protein
MIFSNSAFQLVSFLVAESQAWIPAPRFRGDKLRGNDGGGNSATNSRSESTTVQTMQHFGRSGVAFPEMLNC